MKITEITEIQQLGEGIGSALIGQRAASNIKGLFTGAGAHQLGFDLFLKDFYQDALLSLKKAIKAGVVNPNKRSALGARVANTSVPTANLASKSAATSSVATTPITGAGANKALSDPYQNLKGQVRKLQPAPGTKPLPVKIVQDLAGDIKKLASGDLKSGTYAADKIIKFAKAGYDVSKLSPQWLASSKAGERFLTQSIYRAVTKMLKEHGLVWANLGLRVRLTESVRGTGVFVSTCTPVPVVVSSYDKLNYVFENIISEYDDDSAAGGEGIADFMTDWFGRYMSGVNWQTRQPAFMKLIAAIEASYPNVKGAIKQLGNAAYAVSDKVLPAGAKNAAGVGGPSSPSTAPVGDGAFARMMAGLSPAPLSDKERERQSQIDTSRQSNPKLKR